ncbi:MAG: P1 family peptidase [Firmicutes bacterium]|nr:P1 family peptidase [Bacillota bacterium]
MGVPNDSKIHLTRKYKRGPFNQITDVEGVSIGHVTIDYLDQDVHTGVTAILPHQGSLFQEKVMAGVSVINGFGKSAGLVQVEELGTIESPIIMTNTLSVGTALTASVKYMLARNEDIGVKTGTVNCLVTECNDGSLSDIRGLYVTEQDVLDALANAELAGQEKAGFEEGAVGAGRGMKCMGLKGGIGSASRMIPCDGEDYTLGALVLSNFGVKGNLRIDGQLVGMGREYAEEKGSVIIILATDIPLSERQLKRVAKRATVGLARVGSYLGNGSGDIAIAFTTANKIPHYNESDILDMKMFADAAMDKVFEATAEAVEEAVISSLWHAEGMTGIRGKKVKGLQEIL